MDNLPIQQIFTGSPEQAVEFLSKHGNSINFALFEMATRAEENILHFSTMELNENYGPDDRDFAVEAARVNMKRYRDAIAFFEEIFDVEIDEDAVRKLEEQAHRMFPGGESDEERRGR